MSRCRCTVLTAALTAFLPLTLAAQTPSPLANLARTPPMG